MGVRQLVLLIRGDLISRTKNNKLLNLGKE